MQAVILAGGLGTRLKSITGSVPKPLVLIRGRPFLEYQLRNLEHHGVDQFVFCLGYGAADIQSFFGDGSRWGVTIRYAIETAPLGTAGALRAALDLISDSFFVLNGDTYADLDYAAMARFHRRKVATATIAVRADLVSNGVGRLVLSADRAVDRFTEKATAQQSPWTNAGIYIFERRVVEAIPPAARVSLEYETFPQLIAASARIFGFVFSDYWIDIGTPDSYHRFAVDLLEGKTHVISE